MTDFEYQYPFSSVIAEGKNEKSFVFSHCSEIVEDQSVPCFFWGDLKQSFVAAKCLSVLAKTVRSHFAITPEARAFLRDPIISVGNQQLIFEAFSSCNSVYARVNLKKEALDGEFLQSGCTNIDLNDVSVRALNSVGANERLLVGIGAKETKIITEKQQVAEKKVSLPDRWIKGLGNVQIYLSQMDLAYKLSKTEAIQLFRTLPRTAVKQDYFLTKKGIGYSFSPTQTADSMRIGGVHRLNLLQNLLLLCESLYFYRNENEQSTAIVLNFKDIEMIFLLSESVFRGFSGEGLHLEHLIQEVPMEYLLGINNFFKANEVFQPTMVSIENDIHFQTMQTFQNSLSSIGLLGYNLLENNYFYRRLPFKPERLLRLNPRLQNARKLTDNNEVHILEQTPNSVRAEVKGSAEVKHLVVGYNSDYQCTCNWFTSHKTQRGLCKHILAVKMLVEKSL
ncbi:MAG: SWIM zinc finger family protein [Capnocytophaga sp.]|nr:SWIM zinc finger family protein [Capnocytophaga sp.]